MDSPQPRSKVLHSILWITQLLLASSMIWASTVKLFQPVSEVAVMWPWAGEVSVALLRFTGVVDFLGALGLILPSLLRIQPKLTPIAAIAIIILMICAIVFHISRGESANIAPNFVFAILAAFIAWGRLTKAPITAK